ncbi:MAG TPA: CPBP family glutamic-type intramembrane protease [Candidatus Dormibacteraeota bacterium]|nr:CPBP family glutamic-type intramembrane protease [Candidatus Dormibacteraeota bacterium]
MAQKFPALLFGGLLGVFAVLPHLGRRVPEFLAHAVVVAAAGVVGTYLLPRSRLQVRSTLRAAALAVGVGVVTAVVLVVLDRVLVASTTAGPPLWTGFLYALYGGITEEVVFHYGLLTALAWLALRVTPGSAPYWIAIAVSAAAMGLWLLPAPGAVVLNALGGVVTGWLYWR